MLGARSGQLAAVFGTDTIFIAALGGAAGIPLGLWIESILVSRVSTYFPLPDAQPVPGVAWIRSAAAVLAVTAPFLAGPIFRLRSIPVFAILRRNTGEPGPVRDSGLRPILLILPVAVGIVLATAGNLRSAATLTFAMAICIAAAWAMSGVAARAARGLASRRLPSLAKLALRNVGRYGNWSRIVIVCPAIAVMIFAVALEVGDTVIATVSSALPYPKANLLLADFNDSEHDAVLRFLREQPGVDRVESMTEAWLRLARVDGAPAPELRSLVRCSAIPGASVISDDFAARIGARPGSRLEFETSRGAFSVVVGEVRHPATEERFWLTLITDCSQLAPSERIQIVAISCRPEQLPSLRDAIAARFPALPSATTDEIQSIVTDLTNDAVFFVRATTRAVLLGGLLILAVVVMSTGETRAREAAILSALGARPNSILKIFGAEFAAIGLAAGAIGMLLGCGFIAVPLTLLFHHPQFVWSWRTAGIGIILLPLLTAGAGCLPGYRLLGRKPLEIFRIDV
jgi:putative ABC transport system permease protein